MRGEVLQVRRGWIPRNVWWDVMWVWWVGGGCWWKGRRGVRDVNGGIYAAKTDGGGGIVRGLLRLSAALYRWA